MLAAMTAVPYFRVSTDQQGRSGLGLDAQEATVARFLASRGWTVLERFTEIERGKNDERRELARAMRMCRLTGATLVIAKLDRLSRSTRFIAELAEGDVPFICADMPEANTLTTGVMAAMGQYERELISERTRAGLAAAKARGVRLGNPNLHLVRNSDTRAATRERSRRSAERAAQLSEVIAEIEAETDDRPTLQQIADRLSAAGYTTARGRPFTKVQVHRILQLAPVGAFVGG